MIHYPPSTLSLLSSILSSEIRPTSNVLFTSQCFWSWPLLRLLYCCIFCLTNMATMVPLRTSHMQSTKLSPSSKLKSVTVINLLLLLLLLLFIFIKVGMVFILYMNWIISFTAGYLPKNSSVSFRGDSGLQDGNSSGHNLVGGFYDSGNNIKFSFPTAYTITLLSWTVIEYHQKYADIGELEHVKDIIKWGSDYLLKLFIPPIKSTSSSTTILYSQASCLKGFV